MLVWDLDPYGNRKDTQGLVFGVALWYDGREEWRFLAYGFG